VCTIEKLNFTCLVLQKVNVVITLLAKNVSYWVQPNCRLLYIGGEWKEELVKWLSLSIMVSKISFEDIVCLPFSWFSLSVSLFIFFNTIYVCPFLLKWKFSIVSFIFPEWPFFKRRWANSELLLLISSSSSSSLFSNEWKCHLYFFF